MFHDLLRFIESGKFRLAKFHSGKPKPQSPPPHVPNLRLSVAVLMVEAALQDEHFCERERGMIQSLLTRRFALTDAEYGQLIAAAEEQNKQMVQLHGHTSDINDTMEMAERVELIGMLWDVAYADDQLHPEEELLIRRIAGLISVGDRDRVVARQQAAARHAPPVHHPAE
ncbi:MAG TPA: TerB family tellurite resistance protein [Rhizomicrobium sp.]|nr:TerB family tellurite resistance protein [Rhizomicrobium sp.]